MRIPLSDYRAMNKINQIAFRTHPDTAFFDEDSAPMSEEPSAAQQETSDSLARKNSDGGAQSARGTDTAGEVASRRLPNPSEPGQKSTRQPKRRKNARR